MVRASLLLLWCALACRSQDLGVVGQWLPLAVGDRWTYEMEVRDGPRLQPEILRWQQEEIVIARERVPEGVLVRRKVVFLNRTAPPRWMQVGSESNILVHGSCAYFLTDSARYRGWGAWDAAHQELSAAFRNPLAKGDALPDVCFPLESGKTWGDSSRVRDVWTVAATGRKNPDDPDSVTAGSWRLEAHLASGDDNYVWLQPGVGIVAARSFHNGTDHDEQTRLLRFEAAPRTPPERP